MALSPLSRAALRPPALQTNVIRPATAPGSATPISASGSTPINNRDSIEKGETSRNKSSHQPFVLADHVAFNYLEADESTSVIERKTELKGYQCYVVEQWATSRSHPTFAITTYTGDPSHSVVVGVLNVPTDESTWSPRLRVYFKALNQYHAKRSETSLGILMVTSLAGFPPSLTVISVPTGDLRKQRHDFFVNEDLKRLGCSGRVGLNLACPTGATVAKFHQLYHTSEKNDIYKSVIELVKLCQTALTIFDKLQIDYVDGLLCDVTERAINDWWRDIGSDFYNIDHHDGILGPTTVAGLLGLLMGARNRLHSINAPVAKNAFDIEAMKRGVGTFQKQQRLPRTRRLDRKTLNRLHRLTQKHAEHGGWAVPKAVKSTVAELSGKGGEMVMDAVGRRDRAGIAEIETCNMERFVQLIYGERPKWLWYGRPLKKTKDNVAGNLVLDEQGSVVNNLDFEEKEQGGYAWRKHGSEGIGGQNNKAVPGDTKKTSVNVDHDEDHGLITSAIKRTSGFKDAKSGMGRLRDAVKLSGSHDHQQNKQKAMKEEEVPSSPQSPKPETTEKLRRPLFERAQTSPTNFRTGTPSSPVGQRALAAGAYLDRDSLPAFEFPARDDERSILESVSTWDDSRAASRAGRPISYIDTKENDSAPGLDPRSGSDDVPDLYSEADTATGPSVEGSVFNDDEVDDSIFPHQDSKQRIGRFLRRSVSFSQFLESKPQKRSDDAYARHLSFSLAEESVLSWFPIAEEDPRNPHDLQFSNPSTQMGSEKYFEQESKELRYFINSLGTDIGSWTDAQLTALNTLLNKAERFEVQFNEMYQPQSDSVHALHVSSESVMREQKERLDEGKKEIETLVAKLEYEIDGLKGRVEDVGANVQDFQKGVQRVEERVRELEKDQERNHRGWVCNLM